MLTYVTSDLCNRLQLLSINYITFVSPQNKHTLVIRKDNRRL